MSVLSFFVKQVFYFFFIKKSPPAKFTFKPTDGKKKSKRFFLNNEGEKYVLNANVTTTIATVM